MTSFRTNNNDFGHYLYLDIENHIEQYDNNNHPIYTKTYQYEPDDEMISINNHLWIDTISTYATSGLFIIGITLFLIF